MSVTTSRLKDNLQQINRSTQSSVRAMDATHVLVSSLAMSSTLLGLQTIAVLTRGTSNRRPMYSGPTRCRSSIVTFAMLSSNILRTQNTGNCTNTLIQTNMAEAAHLL